MIQCGFISEIGMSISELLKIKLRIIIKIKRSRLDFNHTGTVEPYTKSSKLIS